LPQIGIDLSVGRWQITNKKGINRKKTGAKKGLFKGDFLIIEIK
jgi:hypothetical protein